MAKVKMKITSKKETEMDVLQEDGTYAPGKTIALSAECVIDGSEENKQFHAFTPGGNLTFGCVRAEAIEGLNEGDEIFLTIDKA